MLLAECAAHHREPRAVADRLDDEHRVRIGEVDARRVTARLELAPVPGEARGQGAGDKLDAYRSLLRKLRMDEQRSAFMGDDLPDLPVLRRCGLAISVPTAPPLVRAHAHYVTRAAAGCGAVREACELIMLAQGTLDARLESYLR